MSRGSPSGFERRRHPRRTPDTGEPLARVRLRTGWEMKAIDISDGGVLVEGFARLLPGTHIDAHIVTKDGRVLVRSRIARAYVCDVQRDLVTYRGALAFDRRLDTTPHGYQVLIAVPGPPPDSGTPYPEEGFVAEGQPEKSL